MVSFKELRARVIQDFQYNQQELIGLGLIILVTAFIFSFRDWGDKEFNLILGLEHFVLVLLIAAISFFFRTACQKIYGLSCAHKAEFKTWWLGIAISFVVAFLSLGWLPLILAGVMVPSFMVRQRLGEFRYGFAYWNNAMISMWGILGNLILALLFAILGHFFPGSYFFNKGIMLNLLVAFYALFPLPQLDGINIFFGSRALYYFAIGLVLLAAVLLLSKTVIGLIIAIIIAVIYTIVSMLIGSEK